MPPDLIRAIRCPFKFAKLFWPSVNFYAKQQEMIESVRDNDETFVVAGNQLGKDFVAGFICTSFFLSPHMYFPTEYVRQVDRDSGGRVPTRRIVTTSVRADHLTILWAEITKFITRSFVPLTVERGGPLAILSMEVRLASEAETRNPDSYLKGIVSAKEEGMTGHHAPYTLLVGDESSGLDDWVYDQGKTWAKKVLAFGNPNPCNNFFRKGIDAGDVKATR